MRAVSSRGRARLAALLLGIGMVAADIVALPAPGWGAGAKSQHGAAVEFSCVDLNHGVAGGGLLVWSLRTVKGVTSGWAHFFASNGQQAKYPISYTVQSNGGGGTVTGSIVTSAGPLYGGNWLYITGTSEYSPGGYLGSYTGTAVDICASLGYPGTL